MNATLSTRQIRLVALLVLVVVAAGGYVVTRHKSSTPTTTPAVTTPAKTTPAQTTPAQTTPTSKAHAHPVTPLRTHGLPVSVVRALQKHSIVVVSVTTPRGEDDAFERAEAKAGAATAGVGYVSVDVFHQRAGTALLRKLGVSDTPEILVVKRPGVVLSDFQGFVDRDVVVQAATDAR